MAASTQPTTCDGLSGNYRYFLGADIAASQSNPLVRVADERLQQLAQTSKFKFSPAVHTTDGRHVYMRNSMVRQGPFAIHDPDCSQPEPHPVHEVLSPDVFQQAEPLKARDRRLFKGHVFRMLTEGDEGQVFLHHNRCAEYQRLVASQKEDPSTAAAVGSSSQPRACQKFPTPPEAGERADRSPPSPPPPTLPNEPLLAASPSSRREAPHLPRERVISPPHVSALTADTSYSFHGDSTSRADSHAIGPSPVPTLQLRTSQLMTYLPNGQFDTSHLSPPGNLGIHRHVEAVPAPAIDHESGGIGDIASTTPIEPNRCLRCAQIAIAVAALAIVIIGILGATGALHTPLAAYGGSIAIGTTILVFAAGYETYHRYQRRAAAAEF